METHGFATTVCRHGNPTRGNESAERACGEAGKDPGNVERETDREKGRGRAHDGNLSCGRSEQELLLLLREAKRNPPCAHTLRFVRLLRVLASASEIFILTGHQRKGNP